MTTVLSVHDAVIQQGYQVAKRTSKNTAVSRAHFFFHKHNTNLLVYNVHWIHKIQPPVDATSNTTRGKF